MPLDEHNIAQNDPQSEAIEGLRRSILDVLRYIMERASMAELFGLQAYLSALASRLTDVGSAEPPEAEDSWEQQLERRRQQAMYQKALAHQMAQLERQFRMQHDLASLAPAQTHQES